MDCSPLTLFVVSEFVQREMLSKLLRLNHERWEEEQKAECRIGNAECEEREEDEEVQVHGWADGVVVRDIWILENK